MNSVAALLAWDEEAHLADMLAGLRHCDMVTAIAAVASAGQAVAAVDVPILRIARRWSTPAVRDSLEWFRGSRADFLLLLGPGAAIVNPEGLRRMTSCMNDTAASIVYGDYYEHGPDGNWRVHQLIDYQAGSIRDTFDFGPVMLCNGRFLGTIESQVRASPADLTCGGLYDLRLRLSECGPVLHLSEPLSRRDTVSGCDCHGSHFAYVDPRNRDYQREMEMIATAHLTRIGAFIAPPGPAPLVDKGDFPVTASVVIPVRNRVGTIADAVRSALSQQTTFAFNVIAVDNHSTDGTSALLARLAQHDPRLIHHLPVRTDLHIGGCWNEAIYSASCGRYAVQLDSDDLYSAAGVLERIVAEFGKKPYALVIGSYTVVDVDLRPLEPGLVDHREWTDANGPNNALRIAGCGAPRAYHVPTLRQFGFPNVGYGEDYAVVLRLCRSYQVGRIYESLYWCRRWEGNSDSTLAPETMNRYDSYKDRVRTIELAARMRQAGGR